MYLKILSCILYLIFVQIAIGETWKAYEDPCNTEIWYYYATACNCEQRKENGGMKCKKMGTSPPYGCSPKELEYCCSGLNKHLPLKENGWFKFAVCLGHMHPSDEKLFVETSSAKKKNLVFDRYYMKILKVLRMRKEQIWMCMSTAKGKEEGIVRWPEDYLLKMRRI